MKQRYKAQKIGGYLNEETLEYDADRWCVMDGTYIISECDVQADARNADTKPILNRSKP